MPQCEHKYDKYTSPYHFYVNPEHVKMLATSMYGWHMCHWRSLNSNIVLFFQSISTTLENKPKLARCTFSAQYCKTATLKIIQKWFVLSDWASRSITCLIPKCASRWYHYRFSGCMGLWNIRIHFQGGGGTFWVMFTCTILTSMTGLTISMTL